MSFVVVVRKVFQLCFAEEQFLAVQCAVCFVGDFLALLATFSGVF